MRLIESSTLKTGMILGKPVMNEKGQVLIQSGVKITDRMVQKLQDLRITYLYIDDEESKGIEPNYPISEETKQEAITSIQTAFEDVSEKDVVSSTLLLDRLGRGFKSTVKQIFKDISQHHEAISLLSNAIGHDRYTFYHSLNVTIYSIAIAKELGLKEEEIVTVGLGALLHDIGKTKVPESILNKPGKLTPEEYSEIKKHSQFGFEILRKCHEISLVSAHIAYQHHERLDGSGYPRGVKNKDIHLFAKIIAVADVFDAVTSNRIYSQAILPHEGMELIFAGAETQFDLNVIRAFRKTVAIYPSGLTVTLNDGRRGIVAKQNNINSERPIIRIIEEQGKKLNIPYSIDLNKNLTATIVETSTTLAGKQEKLENNTSYYTGT
ncbi:histidine kinase [Bacillus coahuilensis p1.1.43]|uniref:Histidine kinase n=1 Tax=Bacillus coahuilensis p1.1.43 TaxID=1150625 RepID=A0A147K6A2_9BACI|nr:HD-GYP domain-containing protein [Bacillus coahuilensis]KUP05374.1 histidine kinase [Bacillus coahuilensis p1.1.43]